MTNSATTWVRIALAFQEPVLVFCSENSPLLAPLLVAAGMTYFEAQEVWVHLHK